MCTGVYWIVGVVVVMISNVHNFTLNLGSTVVAYALVTGRSFRILIVVNPLSNCIFSDPYWSQMRE